VVTTVLLVEDDPEIRRSLTFGLTDLGYLVLGFAEGRDALRRGLPAGPEIVLLDLGLPDIDGSTLLSMMRTVTPIPVIVVTARVEQDEMVRLLNLGADDYVTKPFSLVQLDARIRAVLRRSAPAGPAIIQIGALQIDSQKRNVLLDGALLDLRNIEYRLLLFLAQHEGQVLPSETIALHLWNESAVDTLARLDVHLSSLRNKLGESARLPHYLHRIRGVGIRLSAPAG
jgi:DNA-binding response OmpR family regulator